MKRPTSPLRLFGPEKKTALFRRVNRELFIAAESAFFTRLLERDLREARLRVRSAPLAETAIDEICANAPDLILVSGSLPDMSGIEFVRRIRANASTQFIPLIIISARDSCEDIAAALEAGADDYLTKPFEFPLLKARIDNQFRIRALRDELEHNNAYLRDLGRLKDELLAFCSHDLKVPISTILWHAEVLKEGLLEAPQSRQALGAIESAGRRILSFIDDALELARLGADFSIRDDAHAIPDLINAARELVAGRAADRELAVIYASSEPPDTRLRGDGSLLIRLFQNLLVRAIDRSPPGQNVSIRTRLDDGYIETEIGDSGPPLDERPLADLLRDVKPADGDGIGLAICREIIERHFGAIIVGQTAEGGGLVRVILPLIPPTDPP